ncbi:MAG TPA: plastocyanin/azurin family copper-binding protein, partial [Solirubrobacterales bacterium]|nr:plastocyanin/azurin family copper-binding protein [Solirubrobacterales bacterium]
GSSSSSDSEATSPSSGVGETEGKSAGSASTLDIAAASSGLAYASDSATASAGEVTVDLDNPQPLEHDVAIEDSGGKVVGQTEVITESETSTVVNLKPGTYTFFCTVPGHREAGMEGTLTVK